jgi:hypothetical protein
VTNLDWAGEQSVPGLTARWQNVPVPTSGFKPANGSDKQAVVLNYTGSGREYVEFWGLRKDSAGKWLGAWGGGESLAAMTTTADGVRVWRTTEQPYGAAASGIALVPGLILLDDLERGAINHPVMFAVPNACHAHKPPATRSDGLGGKDCIQYGTKLKLPASIDVDAIRSDSRWCGPSTAGRTAAEAPAAGWDPATSTCPLPPLARMLARAAQSSVLVATDQTYWNNPITFSLESYDRPRTGSWAGVPDGNPYRRYQGCDGIQGTGQWNPATRTTGTPVAAGDWEQDCAPNAAWKGFPWSRLYEVP